MLLALERLTPAERAAFLLHDVLDMPFAEIAVTLGRQEPARRQPAARSATGGARSARRPRRITACLPRSALRLHREMSRAWPLCCARMRCSSPMAAAR
ncbi:sigma factor-like helix-turn-helix DNA-binding protein [Caenibius tardaugens]|uniref:sigma factor-like helix-turn-helix DNA-binding protein n=1 Tax=Caenibius tardaugens TaxID=169176 RepID=UPI0013762080